MTTDWMFVITMTGIFFGLLISAHLLTIKRPGLGTKWLGVYTLLLTSSLAEPFATEGSLSGMLFGGFSLLYGPCLYFYIQSRVRGLSSLHPRQYLHTVPFLSYMILVVLSLFSAQKSVPAQDATPWIDLLLYELLFVQIFTYCIASLAFIRKHKHVILKEDEDVGKMKITFLKILVLMSIVLFFGSWLTTHFFILTSTELSAGFKSTVQLALCIIIFVIALLNTETMHAKKLIKTF
jgi:hypothetical protein